MQRLGGAKKNDREGESKQSRQALDPGLVECLAASSITPRLQVSSSVSPEEGWLRKASIVPNLYPCWCLVASFSFASVLSVDRFRAASLSLRISSDHFRIVASQGSSSSASLVLQCLIYANAVASMHRRKTQQRNPNRSCIK